MKIKSRIVLLLLFAVCSLPGYAAASAGPENLIKGVEAYEFADFQEAEAYLSKACQDKGLTASLRAKAWVYLGLVYLATDRMSGAENAFGHAKGLDSSFALSQEKFSPQAREIFARAPSIPARKPSPPAKAPSLGEIPAAAPAAKAKPAPAANLAPARGYVMQADEREIVLDLGRAQGVKPGDFFAVIKDIKLKHPVSGEIMRRSRKIGLLKVIDAGPELSAAKMVRGKPGQIKAGMRIVKAEPAEAAQAVAQAARPSGNAQAAKALGRAAQKTQRLKPAPGKAGGLRVLVMPPSISAAGAMGIVNEDEFKASEVVKAINIYRPLQAETVDRLPSRNWQALGGADMRQLLEKQGYAVAVQWEVTFSEGESQGTLSCNVFRLGHTPFTVTKWTTVQQDLAAGQRYAKIAARLVGQAMGYIQ